MVPGDYATIQAAVTALAPIGGTICLVAPSYTENVSGSGTESLTIQGVSAASTTVAGDMTFLLPVHLQGFQVTGTVAIYGSPSTVDDMTVVGGPGVGAALGVFGDMTVTASKIVGTGSQPGAFFDGDGQTVLFDGVDISSPQGFALTSTAVNGALTLQNSWIHDSAGGVSINPRTNTFTFVNNTFVKAGSALAFLCPTNYADITMLTYENNLFVNNQVAVSLATQCTMNTPPVFGSNGFFGNTTNFAGTAVEGAGDVKTNPLLQTSTTPPTLGAGSPAIGAGIKSVAPATDYWGNARGTSVDLGCVQSQ